MAGNPNYTAQTWVDYNPTYPASAARFTVLETAVQANAQRTYHLGVNANADYGAKGDGTTDDTTAIQNALNATPAGGVCYLPSTGSAYRTSAPLVVPPNVTFEGEHYASLTYTTALANPCTIKPLASFTGRGVIRLLDKTTGAYTADSVGHRVRYLTIDGSAAPASIRGIDVYGYVREATFDHVTVSKVTSDGFSTTGYGAYTGDARPPLSLRFEHCVSDNNNSAGFVIAGPDTTLLDCNAQGSGSFGYYLAGAPNSLLTACRAEWSGQHGYYITGTGWGNGQGSGGVSLTGCITDRNNFDGVRVDATGSSGHVVLTGCVHRRDGRNSNSGGGSYAAVAAASTTMPVIIDNISVFPGVNDDGTGTNSPETGVRSTGSTYVAVSSGYVHAATTALSNGGTNTTFWRGASVGTAVGTTAAPTRTAPAAAGAIP